MTDLGAKERAIRSLSAQIDQLGEVRNAGTRDPGFKLWRQSTLTLIQRLWPGDETRSTRFRRVPFSPPSTRADQRSTREWYERGCGEVLQLLKGFLEEIETDGLPTAARTPGAGASGTSEAEEVFPTLSLPASGGASTEPRGSSEIPRLPESPVTEASTPAPESTTVPIVETPVETRRTPAEPGGREGSPPATAHAPRAGHGGGKNGSRGPRNGRRGAPKPRLKDLLGFGDDAAIGGSAPAEAAPIPDAQPQDVAPAAVARTPGVTPAAAASPQEIAAIDDATLEIVPSLSVVGPMAVPPTAAPPPAVPDLRQDPDFEAHEVAEEANDRALQSALEAALEPIFEEDAGRAAAEFLQNSPVFGARPRALEPRIAPVSEAFKSPAAVAVAAIAAEVTALGVAEGNRAQVRAALFDLAGQLDHHEFTWDALREAVAFVMQYPPVGRRVLPLLIPYLDEAA